MTVQDIKDMLSDNIVVIKQEMDRGVANPGEWEAGLLTNEQTLRWIERTEEEEKNQEGLRRIPKGNGKRRPRYSRLGEVRKWRRLIASARDVDPS
jgi:hypothetical protein